MAKNLISEYSDIYDDDALDDIYEEDTKKTKMRERKYRRGDYSQARRKKQKEREALTKAWERDVR